MAAESAARKAMEHGVKKVDVFVKGPGSGRETAIRSLQSEGLEVGSITGVTPQACNGVRPPKRRRVGALDHPIHPTPLETGECTTGRS